MNAKVNDIFVSIQGEGKYLGQDQLFIRFYPCNIACDFCDTKLTSYQEYSAGALFEAAKQAIGTQTIDAVSLTGGEPLLQRDVLLEFLPLLKKQGFRTYLETNGILYNELFDLIDSVDIIAMDIKLPSSTKQSPFWHEHEEFLKIAKQRDTFIKVIVCLETQFDDFKKAVQLVAAIEKQTTFIIQPNSAQLSRELAEVMRQFKLYCKDYLSDVRVIPQLHKMVGIK